MIAFPMPSTVRVGPHAYKILRKRRAEMPLIDGEKPNGYQDGNLLEIGVLKSARRSKAQEWLLHECLHALWPNGFDVVEEKVITDLAPKLLQVLQENADLVTYLTT